jgi:hypothetical protein
MKQGQGAIVSDNSSSEQGELRCQHALDEWLEEHCYISYQSALDAAQRALERRDHEVAVFFCRWARNLLERTAHDMRPLGKNVTMNPAMLGKGNRTEVIFPASTVFQVSSLT